MNTEQRTLEAAIRRIEWMTLEISRQQRMRGEQADEIARLKLQIAALLERTNRPD